MAPRKPREKASPRRSALLACFLHGRLSARFVDDDWYQFIEGPGYPSVEEMMDTHYGGEITGAEQREAFMHGWETERGARDHSERYA